MIICCKIKCLIVHYGSHKNHRQCYPVSTGIEELMVYIAKGEEEPEMCGTFNGKGITTGIYFVFCQSPILGRIVTVKTRMKLVNEQVFQVQTGIKIYAVRKTTFEGKVDKCNN